MTSVPNMPCTELHALSRSSTRSSTAAPVATAASASSACVALPRLHAALAEVALGAGTSRRRTTMAKVARSLVFGLGAGSSEVARQADQVWRGRWPATRGLLFTCCFGQNWPCSFEKESSSQDTGIVMAFPKGGCEVCCWL